MASSTFAYTEESASTVTTTAMTLGMRLDAVLERLEHLSSTELYIITVTLMVIASFAVLKPAHSPHDTVNDDERMLNKKKNTAAVIVATATTVTAVVEKPVWFGWIRALNVAFLTCFLASLVAFFQNAEAYSTQAPILYRFLLGWSAYLGYFFSFSGVSILYDGLDSEQQQEQHQKSVPLATKKVLLPAAHSAPVCSDPSSFSKTEAASNNNTVDIKELTDAQVADLVLNNAVKDHELEKKLADCHRAVAVRRLVMAHKLDTLGLPGALDQLPFLHKDVLDYGRVFGANCEIVVGYVPLPVGMVGPLTLNGQSVYVPMATTEGCLVASTNRGAKAISEGNATGAVAVIVRDGITRAPCVRMPTAAAAAHLKLWCEEPQHFAVLKQAFESTTSFGKLKTCVPTVAGKNVYLRLTCFAGDAMGMNMISKGSLAVIEVLKQQFPELLLVALSGNMCTDKKAAATNWIEGRGKSVVVEAIIPEATVRKTLKTTVSAMVHTNIQKNLIGSAMAGTIGGFNAHASNMVSAVFLATGQDPAQNVESSNCITLLEETEHGDLWISCTMPSLEVGTVGGGTSLPAQAACLKAMGCQGGGVIPGENARQLAMVIAAAVMAGELSLLAALAANTLVAAHMQHNRKPVTQKA